MSNEKSLKWEMDEKGYKSFCSLGFTYDSYPSGRLVIYWQRTDGSVCQVDSNCFDQQAACEIAQQHFEVQLKEIQAIASRARKEALREVEIIIKGWKISAYPTKKLEELGYFITSELAKGTV